MEDQPTAVSNPVAPDAKTRFSNRVADYILGRPSYPPATLGFLEEIEALPRQAKVADIGAGTGISTGLFLKEGHEVWAVEPNAEMRAAITDPAKPAENLHVVDGSAEATTLPDGSMDLVVAFQAFHWFDRPAAKAEFKRILKKDGWIALIWNTRFKASTSFAKGYEAMIKEYANDQTRVAHDAIPHKEIEAFLRPSAAYRAEFPNRQVMNYDQAVARVRSASYMPAPGHPRYQAFLDSIKFVFDRCQKNGKVDLQYKTEIFAARV